MKMKNKKGDIPSWFVYLILSIIAILIMIGIFYQTMELV